MRPAWLGEDRQAREPKTFSKWPKVNGKPYESPSDGSTIVLCSEPVGMSAMQVMTWKVYQSE